jgi:hypothetical protein
MSDNNSPRKIGRKSIDVAIRDRNYTITSLSIAGVDKLRENINLIIANCMRQLQAMYGMNWAVVKKRGPIYRFFNSKKPSVSITPTGMDFLDNFLKTTMQNILDLAESASGLPHELFDRKNKDSLSIDELRDLAEVIFEANNLGFIWTALTNWMNQAKANPKEDLSHNLRSLAPSVNGIQDIR